MQMIDGFTCPKTGAKFWCETLKHLFELAYESKKGHTMKIFFFWISFLI